MSLYTQSVDNKPDPQPPEKVITKSGVNDPPEVNSEPPEEDKVIEYPTYSGPPEWDKVMDDGPPEAKSSPPEVNSSPLRRIM